jgi:hypothetical protein
MNLLVGSEHGAACPYLPHMRMEANIGEWSTRNGVYRGESGETPSPRITQEVAGVWAIDCAL